MGPLHCPLCIGLAVLSFSRVAAHALLLQRMAGWRPGWRLGWLGGLTPARA